MALETLQVRHVTIPTDQGEVPGILTLPRNPLGVVLFAHASTKSRHCLGNTALSRMLAEAGVGSLRLDLLTEAEAAERIHLFDMELLTHRLHQATEWVRAQPEARELGVGYFGASTSAAAALIAAAREPAVSAVVCRSGRITLAGHFLSRVRCPVLLIVGDRDRELILSTRKASPSIAGPHELAVVAGAGHLFAEPGALDLVGCLASEWFVSHLQSGAASGAGLSTGAVG